MSEGKVGTELTDCLLCNSSRYRLLFIGSDRLHGFPGEFPVVECLDCGLVYLQERPDSNSLGGYYPHTYAPYNPGFGWVTWLQSRLLSLRARRFARLIEPGGTVLEVGCATGDLLARIKDLFGHKVVGLEMSEVASHTGRSRFGLNILCGTLDQADFKPASFDLIILRHVLEHLPNPLASLTKLKDLLKPGGYLVIEGPNYDGLDRTVFGPRWYDYDVPRHLFIPSVTTLRLMFDRFGLHVVTIRHSWLPNDWIGSVHNLIVEKFGRRSWTERIRFSNPFCILLGLPFGVLQMLLRRSGRVEVVAVKR